MSTSGLTVGIDATPVLGRRTGVGRYTAGLLDGLAATAQLSVVATAFTARGAHLLPSMAPANASVRRRPVPARLLKHAWAHFELPPVEWLCGRVDIFHATNFVLPPLRRARGVVTIHDLAYLRHPATVAGPTLDYRTLALRSVRRATIVCAPSSTVAAEVSDEYQVDSGRIVVTSPGVDAAWFSSAPPTAELRQRLRLPEAGSPYLLAVGTLEPRKNLDRLLDAHEAIWRAGLHVPLVLVGAAGWGRQPLLVRRPAGSVIVTGYVSDEELQAVTAGATALAFPSIYEGFGLPPLEALAAGVPTVCADLPVTREVLGDAAQYVSPHDTDAWAAALHRAVTAPPDAATRARGWQQALIYTWARFIDQALVAYKLATA